MFRKPALNMCCAWKHIATEHLTPLRESGSFSPWDVCWTSQVCDVWETDWRIRSGPPFFVRVPSELISLFIHPSFCPSFHLSGCLVIYPIVLPSVYSFDRPSTCLSVYPFLHPSIYSSICLFVNQFIYQLSIHSFIGPPIVLFIRPSLHSTVYCSSIHSFVHLHPFIQPFIRHPSVHPWIVLSFCVVDCPSIHSSVQS